MTNGFRKAGIDVVGGIDFDADCKATYEANHPESNFVHADIKNLTFNELSKRLKIKRNDEQLIFIGCSPCQYWTKIKTDKKKSEESKNLLSDFRRFVDYYNPGVVVIENVPGIQSRKQESPLKEFVAFLTGKGYCFDNRIINAADYGVPQTRKRFLLIASRLIQQISLPTPLIRSQPLVREFIGPDIGFPVLAAGTTDKTHTMHWTAVLSDKNLMRIKSTPANGGTRLAYVHDEDMAISSQFKNLSSFVDTYGRMSWDKPAPTITTKFISLSNGRFGHPEQDRALSLREGAVLQTFDLNYIFHGSGLGSIARQIGNAVPPTLAKAIAETIVFQHSNMKK